MIVIEQQLHGYRHGHELLSASTRLPARDQDLVDRLSDVAGPLGPGERFVSYLTCYPLPSGSHYVFARTWQDLAAPRAGCVRTRSLLVRMEDWIAFEQPASLAEAATKGGPTDPAETLSLRPTSLRPLPPVEGPGTELLEALFLEDRMPVAVFGAEMPEIIALRLLTAIWPSYRRNFTLSTFCNSPRSIAKKSFDLVFAPVDARSRFSDWKGRRVDGRRAAAARHRWSSSIVDRVFRAENPSLQGLDVLGEMAGDKRGSEDALRVSLLWDELHRKVASEPHAALGLLDIAKTRVARSAELVKDLGPALALAAANAVTTMPPREAWRFLKTLAGKVGDSHLRLSVAKSIRTSAITLARRRPRDAVEVLPALLGGESHDLLVGALGDGLAGCVPDEIARLLSGLRPDELIRLLVASPALAEEVLRKDAGLDALMAEGLGEAGPDLQEKGRRWLLRYMVSERHVDSFRILVSGMTGKELVDQVTRLNDANRLQSPGLNGVIVDEAEQVGAVPLVRDFVVRLDRSPDADSMLGALIAPTEDSVRWLIDGSFVGDNRRRSLLLRLIESASTDQLRRIFQEADLLPRVVRMLGQLDSVEAEPLARIAESVPMPAENFLDLLFRVLPVVEGRRAAHLASRGLEVSLGQELGTSREAAIEQLLETGGRDVNGAKAIRAGLSVGVPAGLASQNLRLFEKASPGVRAQFVNEPEALAEAIIGRQVIDLSYEATDAAARLLWDANAGNRSAFTRACARLLPFVLRERRQPASALIAAAFPPVYRELQQERIPDFLSLMFPFLDWDRCKTARRELANAFSSSDWRATDIALAAARAGDTERILRNIVHFDKGPVALAEIERDAQRIPAPWRLEVERAVVRLRSGKKA